MNVICGNEFWYEIHKYKFKYVTIANFVPIIIAINNIIDLRPFSSNILIVVCPLKHQQTLIL